MRRLALAAAALLAAGAWLVGWNAGGALLGLGGLLSLGYGYGRFPRERAFDAEAPPLARRTVDPDERAAAFERGDAKAPRASLFDAFRARSRTVDRALKDTSRRARPFLEPWPSVDPRHPRLAEAMDALRRGDER